MEKIPKANLPNLHYELQRGIIQSKKNKPITAQLMYDMCITPNLYATGTL